MGYGYKKTTATTMTKVIVKAANLRSRVCFTIVRFYSLILCLAQYLAQLSDYVFDAVGSLEE